MAEAVVGMVVEQLVSEAAGWLKEEISLVKGVKKKLDNMEDKMKSIQKVLEDAENQNVKKENVKLNFWLKKLQDVSYDMDDVLDEWRTRALIREREEAEKDNTSNEIVGSSSSSTSSPTTCLSLKKLNCFSNIKQLPRRREIALSIKDINERIESVFLDMKEFELASKVVGNDGLDKIISRTTTSFVDESEVYGRGEDKERLLSKVLSTNDEQEKTFQVILIDPLGSGFLSSGAKFIENLPKSDARNMLERFQPANLEHNQKLYNQVNEFAARKGCSPSQLALAWIHHQGNDVCPIPGTTKVENLNHNIAALSVELSAEDMVELEAIATTDAVKGGRSFGASINTWENSDTPPLSSWKAT